MKKQFKVVMLPTTNKSMLHLAETKNSEKTVLINSVEDTRESDLYKSKPQLLIIISDDKIKEDDWLYSKSHNKVFKCTNEDDLEHYSGELSKVIASSHKKTTPKCWIPESFLNAYSKAYNQDSPIKEVALEITEDFDLEYYTPAGGIECAKKTNKRVLIKTREDKSVIIHKNKTYSEEEVKAIAQEAWIESFFTKRNTDITGFKEWFDKKSNCL